MNAGELTTLARKALGAWGLSAAGVSLVAQRENLVFRVTQGDQTTALRLHRPGYQSPQMVLSELAWMAQLGTQGITVPTPVRTRTGTLLTQVEGHHADLLTWLPGRPLGATAKPLNLPNRQGTFWKMGQLMARVHGVSDAWTRPPDFLRQHWDLDGLLGPSPLWGRFWDNPGLTPDQRRRVLMARDHLRADLDAADLDYGLIHADMLRENVLVDGDTLGLIDFDDSGFGFRLFDLATSLFKNRAEPDYPDLEAAFLSGYHSERFIDKGLLPQFMLIRALSYLGWIITRMEEPGAQDRQKRFLSDCLPLVDAYLSGQAAH